MALKYPELFQPFKIGRLEIKNRIVMSGMHNIGWKDENDIITDEVIDYFEARAKGGVGLIISGANQPDFQFDNGVIMNNPFRHPGTFASQHKKLADRVHSYGCKLFIQFGYGGGRVDFPEWIPGEGIAADDSSNRWDSSIQHRALTKKEIKNIIDASVFASSVCKQTGCDGIDINCYGGYLLDQFLQPCFNHRTDEYAGLDGGIKIMAEIVRGIREVCGKDFPVSCRLGVRQHIKEEGKAGLAEEKYTEYGRTPEESIYVARKLEEAGYDAIYIGDGTYDSFYWLYPPMYQKEGLWLDDVAELTKAVSVPVFCPGKIVTPDVANEAVKNGKVTAVALGRALLADPEWANKARLGLEEEIRPCIGCNIACVGHIFAGLPMGCAVNANVMREKEMDTIVPVQNRKKVAVIGGGIAGMECARIAAERGHEVTIYEKSDKLGGTFISASVPEEKIAARRLLAWYDREIEKAEVAVKFNSELTLEDVKKLDCDEIVVATGNVPKIPPIPGVNGSNVYSPVKVLTGEQKIPKGSKVVVIGGGLVGCEAALYLKQEEAFEDITIVEGLGELMCGGLEPQPIGNKLMICDLIDFHKIKLQMNSMLNRIEDGKVVVNCNGEEKEMKADAVIMSLGLASNDRLYREIYENIPKKVWRIGDALSASNLMFGIRDANAIARQI